MKQPIKFEHHGLSCVRQSDTVYYVSDARRLLGGVVRHLMPSPDGKGYIKRFRAFGLDFESLSDAVREFRKIPGVTLL